MRKKKTLDQIREDVKKIIPPEPEPKLETGITSEPEPKRGRPTGSGNKKFTRETIKNLLKTPFTIAKGVTSYEGFQITPLIEDEIVDAGYQVYLDFGFEIYSKWLNLVTFCVLYGGVLVTTSLGYMNYAKLKRKTQDSGNSGETRDGKDNPDKTDNPARPEGK
jgi:hypothetical protein